MTTVLDLCEVCRKPAKISLHLNDEIERCDKCDRIIHEPAHYFCSLKCLKRWIEKQAQEIN